MMYIVLRYLWGPLNILVDYGEIIFIAFVSRLVASLLDISSFPSKKILKQLIIIMLGIYQIDLYIRRSCDQLPFYSIRGMVYTIALTYASYSAVTDRFRTLLARANLMNQRAICTISLYFIAFAPMLYNEYRIGKSIHDRQYCFLRPILMSMAMKLISLTTVLNRHKSPMSLLAYIIHPASTILGVWHPYEMENSGERASRNKKWLQSIVNFGAQLLKIVMILTVSANISELIDFIESTGTPYELKRMAHVYLIALDFRFSHYFSCYLASSFIGPIRHNTFETNKFCDIMKVEWPRSLVDVVTKWNIPMHFWLKKYIFTRVMIQWNVEVAIFATYLVSSVLHGFKFHIWSVLLTLGLLTWTEYKLRWRLARRLDACVEAQPCQYKRNLRTGKLKCVKGHSRNIHNSFVVKLTNFFFRLSAIIQLAYLGYIFVGNTDEATYMNAIQRWSSIYFYGHILGAFNYLLLFFVGLT
jgi:hypothetical protein